MIQPGRNILGAQVNVLGLTFKEDCPDIRNSKVIDMIAELREFGVEVHVHDPWPTPRDALHEYGIKLRCLGGAARGRRAHPRGGAQALPRDPGAGTT